MMEQLFCCGTVQGWRGVLLETQGRRRRRRKARGHHCPTLGLGDPSQPPHTSLAAAGRGQGRTPRPGRDPAGGHQALGTGRIDPTGHGRSSSCPFHALPCTVPCTTEGVLQPLSPLGVPGGSDVPRGDISMPLPGPSGVPQLSHHQQQGWARRSQLTPSLLGLRAQPSPGGVQLVPCSPPAPRCRPRGAPSAATAAPGPAASFRLIGAIIPGLNLGVTGEVRAGWRRAADSWQEVSSGP